MSEPMAKTKDAPKQEQPRAATQDIDPYNIDDPLAMERWMMSKGWKPRGNPRHPYTKWTHPKLNTEYKVDKIPVIAPHLEGYDPQTKLPIYNQRPVQIKNEHGQVVACQQTRVTFPIEPMTFDKAVNLQLEWDEAAAKQVA